MVTKSTKKPSAKKPTKKAAKSAAATGSETAPAKVRDVRAKTARREAHRSALAGSATLKMVRISAQKARLALNMIKGRQVEQGLNILRFTPKKSARLVLKVLEAAVANARNVRGSDPDKLWITGGRVDMGRSIKRFMPRARGSASPIIMRSAHITIELSEKR